MNCLNESVIDNRNINKLRDYRVIIIGEIHDAKNFIFYNNLLDVVKPEYFISELVSDDIVLTQKELKDRLSKTTNGKFIKNIPDYQDNYSVYKLAYVHKCKLIGCNPYEIKRKDFSMDEEDRIREKFMLERIKKYDKYKCVVQLGDHHLRSIPISQEFLDYCGDTEDDRGIVKDLKVSNPSPIYSYYHNKPYAIISRVKSNYDNEKKFIKLGPFLNEASISTYKKIPLTKENIDKYKNKAKYLSHFRTGDDYSGYIWLKNNEPVGACNVRKSDNYIQAIEVSTDYQNQGLGKEMLDVCINQLGADKLSVNKKNKIAYDMYIKRGFKTNSEDDTMYYMSLKSSIKENANQRLFESYLVERSLSSNKIYTLYHGTYIDNLDIINANSYNHGKRYENMKMSSYWFLDKKYAIAFATAEMVNSLSDNVYVLIDNDMKFIVDEQYKSEVEDILKNNNSYVYSIEIEGKYVGGGQSRYFPEYSIDFPVRPTNKEVIEYSKMKPYIKYISTKNYNEIIEKYKNDKMRFNTSLKERIFNPFIYDKDSEIIRSKRKYKKFIKENTNQWLIEAFLQESSNDITYSSNFSDMQDIAKTLSKSELNNIGITGKEKKDDPYLVYRSVLLVNKDPAAFIDVYYSPEEGMDGGIVCVACKKEYRGNGYTKILVEKMKKEINKSKIKKVYWETTKGNKASGILAKQCGFKPSENINKSDDNYVYEFK